MFIELFKIITWV